MNSGTQSADIVAKISPSVMRRTIAVGTICALALLFLSLAFTTEGAPPLLRVMFLALAAFSAWVGLRVWRATTRSVVLRADGSITESGDEGRHLAHVRDIREVARGPFALKPSHGMTILLRERAKTGWAPGLWWRVGRRLGLGGVTRSHEGKTMAEAIEMLRQQHMASQD